MEVVAEPEWYSPSVDDNGKYVDNIPLIRHGLRCPCGSRRDKIYDARTFPAHIKTKCHQKWLECVNKNRANYYVENEKLRETIQNQRLIIAKMEKEIQSKSLTIDYLTKQLQRSEMTAGAENLLEFD